MQNLIEDEIPQFITIKNGNIYIGYDKNTPISVIRDSYHFTLTIPMSQNQHLLDPFHFYLNHKNLQVNESTFLSYHGSRLSLIEIKSGRVIYEKIFIDDSINDMTLTDQNGIVIVAYRYRIGIVRVTRFRLHFIKISFLVGLKISSISFVRKNTVLLASH